jgi:hypothetical protein
MLAASTTFSQWEQKSCFREDMGKPDPCRSQAISSSIFSRLSSRFRHGNPYPLTLTGPSSNALYVIGAEEVK